MFERFTQRARQMVVLAQEEARMLRHNYIGTEHILLGLLRERDGFAAHALGSLGITLEMVRGDVARIVGAGEDQTQGMIPFTPRAKSVLSFALREALALRHSYIGTEHILLGLVREGEGVAVRILSDHDADPERVRNTVIRMLSPAGAEDPGFDPPPVGAEDPGFDPPPAGPPPFEPPGSHRPDEPATESEANLGWRGRPMALAALGAARLARAAFDPRRTGGLEPLEMQLLVRLTLGSADGTGAEPGELLDSLTASMAADLDDLRLAVKSLGWERLVVIDDEQDNDVRIAITTDGVGVVEQWLRRAAPLFGNWPPDNPDADDAVG
jgi:hypothetical protein